MANNNMMKVVLCFLVLATAVLSGCQSSNLQTRTYLKPGYEVSMLKRFTWDSKQSMSYLGVLFGAVHKNLEARLKSSTLKALSERGYMSVGTDANPQFLVSIVAGAIEQSASAEINLDNSVTWSQTNEYLQGGISLVFKDLSRKEILWQSTATQRITKRQLQNQDGSVIFRLLENIMSNLPESAQTHRVS